MRDDIKRMAVMGAQRVQMRHAMQQMISLFRDTDVGESVRWKVLLRMRDALQSHGIPSATSETLVATMTLNVSDAVYEDNSDLVHELIDSMASFIARIYVQIGKDMRAITPDAAIIAMAPTFKVEMDF